MKLFIVLLQILVMRWVPECFVDPVLEFEGITQMTNMLVTFYRKRVTTTAWKQILTLCLILLIDCNGYHTCSVLTWEIIETKWYENSVFFF